jgi:hypothetical protein
MLSLRELQLRFSRAIAPAGAGDPSLLGLVESRGGLGSAERLAIYADMYQARLVDVLREDYPRVLAIVGDDEFRAVACRYLAAHPSTHPSVRHVGHRVPEFLAGEPSAPRFLADLARLEWARVEVFDAPDAEPLRPADLAAVPAQEWPDLRFRRVPASLIVESAWPVHRIWDAAGAPGDEPIAVEPEASTLRVWREGFDVSHAAMGALEVRALRALDRGESFAGICAALEDALDAGAAQAVGGLLMRWLEDELLVRG